MMGTFNDSLGGLTTGAGIGSAFGPWGTAIGGLLGGVGGFLGLGKSKPAKIKDHPIYNQQQMDLINQMLSGSQEINPVAFSYLQKLLSEDPEALKDFEQPYLDAFQNETIPGIAERFSGLGARSSSAFNQTMAQGGKDLQTQLAALRAGLKNQALGHLNNYNQLGLKQLNTPYIKGGTQGIFDSLAPAAGDIFAKVASNAINKYWGF